MQMIFDLKKTPLEPFILYSLSNYTLMSNKTIHPQNHKCCSIISTPQPPSPCPLILSQDHHHHRAPLWAHTAKPCYATSVIVRTPSHFLSSSLIPNSKTHRNNTAILVANSLVANSSTPVSNPSTSLAHVEDGP